MWFCELCKKDSNSITKSSNVKSTTHIKNKVISRTSNNLSNETYTYLNPEVDQVDGLFERIFDDCKHFFHRLEYKCVFVIKVIHQTHGTLSFFFKQNKKSTSGGG